MKEDGDLGLTLRFPQGEMFSAFEAGNRHSVIWVSLPHHWRTLCGEKTLPVSVVSTVFYLGKNRTD